MSKAVQLTCHPLAVGGYLAQITLNAPQKRNALCEPMLLALGDLLSNVAADDEAVAVLLDSGSSHAFCAGADARQIQTLTLSGTENARQIDDFFARCYRLLYELHQFPKPVVCWASGAVMGLGLGLLAAASHRIATPKSLLAMPEIAIGFYPDAGATWFLHHMPGHSGLFCALTGVQLNAGDALYSGLADYVLPDTRKPQLIQQLTRLDWQFELEADAEMLTIELTDFEAEANTRLPPSHLKQRADLIESLCEDKSPAAIDKAFHGLLGDDVWLNEAGRTFAGGAASTACIVLEQYQRGEGLLLAEALQLEMVISANRARDLEFIEGVRARLFDKDDRPQWAFRSLSEVPPELISGFFTAPWQQHPLADLGT
ncbi:enoyl-CoA hydratase/carnithine racemase [Litorivivens lipolytica]|uniref:3-hydroxyisobutyryl-CoA hydrolase n=1 Tax=Litorivivens lipolytica TaxID=1524264 RepID=A0A7W4W3J1_9GAMM|nr:enoyl-CoA hydratase/isomerase family protein [Litorivivens lipolytica]MBB3046795.1 enoyl-CoA hydratase/carnithine racemase [Litorivivens lipolytica]